MHGSDDCQCLTCTRTNDVIARLRAEEEAAWEPLMGGDHQRPSAQVLELKPQTPRYRMRITEGCSLPQEDRREFLTAFGRAFERNPHAFHRINDDDLCKTGRGVALVETEGRVISGVLFDRVMDGTTACQLYFKAFFSDGTVPGIGRHLVAHIIVREEARMGQRPSACADIRIMPDGNCNPAPARSFTRLGFRPERVCSARINGTAADGHLMQSREDQDAYRYLRIGAEANDLNRRARDIIGEWGGEAIEVRS